MAEEKRVLEWQETDEIELEPGLFNLRLHTNAGTVDARFHPAEGSTRGAVWVGGAGGGLEGPARGLYPEMCRRLQAQGISGVRLHYRRPNHLEDCVLDTLLGAEYLHLNGVERVAIIGHSFGGAVVITAAAVSEKIHACVSMSTQTYGTDLAPEISPKPLLLIHGTADEILPDSCSRQVYRQAREPKEIVLYEGARHGLDECRDELIEVLTSWLATHL